MAPGTVAGGGSVEADRAGTGPEQGGGGGGVEDRARAALCQPGHGGAARGARPGKVGQGERAQRARRDGVGDGDGRAGASQGVRQLGVGGAQPGGRAERDDQDVHPQVTAPLVGSGWMALKPGVRCSAIGWIGEVGRT